MRMFKFIGALIVVLAFGMIGVATASAVEVLWPWLPGSVGETFTGELHPKTEAILQETKENGEDGEVKIECKALSILLAGSELLEEGSTNKKDAVLALATLHFTGCTTSGLPVHSPGDEPGVILSHVEMHNCLIEWLKKAKQDGVLILPLETVIEIGATVVTTVLDKKGTGFVAPIKKIGVSEYLLDARQTGGLQEVKLCEGGEEESLLTLLAGAKKENKAAEAAKAIIKFDKTKDAEEVLS